MKRQRDTSGTVRVPTLLGAQGIFNVGFYAVVPFIAIVLAEDFALGGAAIGLVLGTRTAAQQGMFLLGGVLADRFGARSLILTGCAVRALGFGTLAVSVSWHHSLPLFVVGTVLTGLGGALFSPALSTLVALAQSQRETLSQSETQPGVRAPHRAPRTTLFAALSVVGETGAAIGPLLGAALLGWGFAVTAASGAGLFIIVGFVLTRLLPRTSSTQSEAHGPQLSDDASQESPRTRRSRRCASLHHRGFVCFALLHAVDLLSYNQLYLSLPTEIRRSGAGAETLAALFALVSILTITAQLPIARLARRLGPHRALPLGYITTSAGFLVLAASTTTTMPEGLEIAPAVAAVVLWILGHLMVGPVALDLVPRFAGNTKWGSYYGLLATAGGVAVLVGNAAVGSLLPLTESSSSLAWAPWILLGALPLISAALIGRTLPPHPQTTPAIPSQELSVSTHQEST
ncbi:MFS transporter [Nesterenkonia sandarakina]|uniref:Nitrate/nitrite transporter NarK n=1 Tax=Nesterenkonia sandarakina TaxID=272918 RepID=A0A2T0YBC3_9MICC|nr:MFS transporter [Nesterenkonia sandarakina]PRZ12012.1 nitrate/nitrite transporter NarK [Nesterenkonia sandarakina]